jgi:hypothetical protein
MQIPQQKKLTAHLVVLWLCVASLSFVNAQNNPVPQAAHIPDFENHTDPDPLSKILFRKDALHPISESRADMEIRVYFIGVGTLAYPSWVWVIQYANQKLAATKYLYQYPDLDFPESHSGYTKIDGDAQSNVYVKKISHDIMMEPAAFFDSLALNHFFTLETTNNDLFSDVAGKDPIFAKNFYSSGYIRHDHSADVEIKVGDHIRSFQIFRGEAYHKYSPENEFIKDGANIYRLLNKFFEEK